MTHVKGERPKYLNQVVSPPGLVPARATASRVKKGKIQYLLEWDNLQWRNGRTISRWINEDKLTPYTPRSGKSVKDSFSRLVRDVSLYLKSEPIRLFKIVRYKWNRYRTRNDYI